MIYVYIDFFKNTEFLKSQLHSSGNTTSKQRWRYIYIYIYVYIYIYICLHTFMYICIYHMDI